MFVPDVIQVSRARNDVYQSSRVLLNDREGRTVLKTLTMFVVLLLLQGCTAMVVGAAVGVVTTVAVETAKVPFKVTGAVIDVATDDEDD